ncbi:MAG: virulence RhuM family protein [Salinivirgaceae bacterium]|nr:virulence RhuM family protein [Salinivirgaceae bacterium]
MKNNLPTVDNSEIVLYNPNDTIRLEVRMNDETVWLTQAQMAELFQTTRNNVTLHISNIFKEGELDKNSVCKESLLTAVDGKLYKTKFYNLDVIISVGYRVKSVRGTQFRQWANNVLKEYLLKGYSVNQRIEKLEQRVSQTESKIDFFVRTSLPPVEGIFFDGQIFDAYELICRLVKNAVRRIILIDNYIDETVLTMLDKRASGVQAEIYTKQISAQLQLDINSHNAQYQPIVVKTLTQSHDRFLLIDNTVYHVGASIKDAGRKWFAIMKMQETTADEIVRKLI